MSLALIVMLPFIGALFPALLLREQGEMPAPQRLSLLA